MWKKNQATAFEMVTLLNLFYSTMMFWYFWSIMWKRTITIETVYWLFPFMNQFYNFFMNRINMFCHVWFSGEKWDLKGFFSSWTICAWRFKQIYEQKIWKPEGVESIQVWITDYRCKWFLFLMNWCKMNTQSRLFSKSFTALGTFKWLWMCVTSMSFFPR